MTAPTLPADRTGTPDAPPRTSTRGLADRRLPRRPEVSALTYALGVSAFIMAADNATFWGRAYAVFGDHPLQLLGWGMAVWMLTLLTLVLFGLRVLLRPAAVVLLTLSAVTSYYMDKLGIVIDREMIQNAMLTTVTESKHLVTANFVIHVLVWGILPSVAAMWFKVRPAGMLGGLWRWVMTVALTVAVFAAALFSDYKAFSAVARERKDVLASYQPGAAIGGAARYAKMMLKSRDVTVAPLGRDARKGPLVTAAAKPVLTVVFVGETARAQNFALNGYDRPTTPQLAQRGVVNFSDVTSCGTSTAVSVPCMMSNLTQDGYSYDAAIRQENLIDVLGHAGVDVLWWDNNTGDQGTASRLGRVRRMGPSDDPAACAQGECTDAVFLAPLAAAVPDITRDTVLFIHMIGSHGPSYYLRYPREFETFKPACHTAEFADCTAEEITNAYDNTILFTDHVISRTIDMLNAQETVLPAVVFLSDHGESLGENGLYLHAAPYFMAPETQTSVPMVMWLSDAYRNALGVDGSCLAAKADAPVTQDNLFHTVLGLMDVTTAVRSADLDLTRGCNGT